MSDNPDGVQRTPENRSGDGYEDLLTALATDTARDPFERETRLSWSAETDAVDVHTAERSLMRRFLSHPEFTLRWVEVRAGERGSRAVDAEDISETWDGEDILSINGSLPIGCVLVRADARTAGGHADIVTRTVLDSRGDSP